MEKYERTTTEQYKNELLNSRNIKAMKEVTWHRKMSVTTDAAPVD